MLIWFISNIAGMSFHVCVYCPTSHIFLFSSVQSLSRVQCFVTPWTAARQASLSITNSRSLPKPMSTESVMPSSPLILCRPLLLLPLILPSIRVFPRSQLFAWGGQITGVSGFFFHCHILFHSIIMRVFSLAELDVDSNHKSYQQCEFELLFFLFFRNWDRLWINPWLRSLCALCGPPVPQRPYPCKLQAF